MFFFILGDDNSRRVSKPVAVPAILLLCAIVFVFESLGGETFVSGMGLVPWEVVHNEDITETREVLRSGQAVQIVHGPAPLSPYATFLTSMFIHGGFLHLALNMLYLWIFADQIEDRFGPLRFIGFYLLCGVFAGAAEVAISPSSVVPIIGASGAISGMMGAYMVLFPRNQLRAMFLFFSFRISAKAYLTIYFASQIFDILSRQPTGVAYWAHIGGFITGASVGLLVKTGYIAGFSQPTAEPARA